MKPPLRYPVLTALSESQTEQLHELFQHEWWTVGRSLADVQTMLQHSDFIFAIEDPESHQLLAFARVLTDRIFKALVFDLVVHPEHRADGIGSFLLEHILAHPDLSRVRHTELYCLPERSQFYRRHDFTSELGNLHFMRRTHKTPST